MTTDLSYVRLTVRDRLPIRARWFIGECPLDYDFSKAQSDLSTIRESDLNGQIEAEWQRLYIFGEQNYCEGGGATPFLTVHSETGWICSLDFERNEEPVFSLNSNIDCFIETWLELNKALRECSYLITELPRILERLDPEAYPQSEWRLLCEEFISS